MAWKLKSWTEFSFFHYVLALCPSILWSKHWLEKRGRGRAAELWGKFLWVGCRKQLENFLWRLAPMKMHCFKLWQLNHAAANQVLPLASSAALLLNSLWGGGGPWSCACALDADANEYLEVELASWRWSFELIATILFIIVIIIIVTIIYRNWCTAPRQHQHQHNI